MPWKKDDAGAFVVDANGNPIFLTDDKEEKSVDFPAMSTALTKANREAAERKEKLRAADDAAKAWAGIEDIPGFIATAKKDAEAVKAMSDKEKSAEEATRARVLAATGPLEQQIAEWKGKYDDVVKQYHASTIRSQFGTSRYVTEELVSPAMAQELFARFFSIGDDGKVIGKDEAGNIIYDESGPAGFDTALRKIVASSPHKAFVTKGSTQSGSGANPGVSNGGGGGTKTMKRAEFDKLGPVEKMARMKEGYKITN